MRQRVYQIALGYEDANDCDSLRSDFPRVRMEAILSAGFIPKAEALPAALRALNHERDRFIETALKQTVEALEPWWRPALEAGTLEFAKAEHREFIGLAAGLGFDKRLGTFLKKKSPPADEIAAIKTQLVSFGNAKHARMVVAALAKQKGAKNKAFTVELLDGLRRLSGRSGISPGRKLISLRKLLSNRDEEIAAATAKALGAWKVKGTESALRTLLKDANRSDDTRRAAAVALGDLGDVKELKRMASSGTIGNRTLGVHGLAAADLGEAASAAALLMGENPGTFDPVLLLKSFLERDKGTAAIADALTNARLHPGVVARVAEFHRETGLLPGSLAARFQPGAGKSLSAVLLRENRKTLVADVEKLGDPSRGEQIYRRRTLACTRCHGIGPAGPVVGPNLVAVGAAAQTDYMVESILEPNKAIAEHYETKMILTRDGRVRTGVITFKGDKEIVIRDSALEGREVRIPAESIRKMKGAASLMPEGLANQLKSRQEFLDLAKFISRLGRPGPYANRERPFIRKWEVQATEGAAWETVYSMVNGELPASDLGTGVARGYVNIQVPGAVKLILNGTAGLRLRIDGREIPDPNAPFELGRGRRQFSFVIDRAQRGAAGLRVELAAAPGSPAKFQPEGGK